MMIEPARKERTGSAPPPKPDKPVARQRGEPGPRALSGIAAPNSFAAGDA